MRRIGCTCSLAAMLMSVAPLLPRCQAATDVVETAIVALQDNPTNGAKFNALAKAVSTARSSPNQARGLAICYLGYRLGNQAPLALKVQQQLIQNYPDSAYLAYIADTQLFSQVECEDCEGTGVVESPCPKCTDGRCPNCGGRGTRPGIDSEITCTACRGTGNCRFCNGKGVETKRCPACRGRGQHYTLKQEETTQRYLALIQHPLETDDSSSPPPRIGKAIMLNSAQLAQFNSAYQKATSLQKHGVYLRFLKQIGSSPDNPTPLVTPFPDALKLTIEDVSIGRDIDKNQRYYYAVLSNEAGVRYRLIIPEANETFATGLKKGETLTSSGWLCEVAGVPPTAKADLYRSMDDFLSLQ
jgi:hypothetical protein